MGGDTLDQPGPSFPQSRDQKTRCGLRRPFQNAHIFKAGLFSMSFGQF